MDPAPSSETPKPINIPKPKNVKTLNLKSDKDTKFEIQFFVYENNLIFEGHTKNIIPQKNYIKIYSLDNVQTNKYFLICETINEIYDEILSQISQNEKEVKIIEKNNNLILTIPLNTNKIKECSFEINEVENNANGQINELYTIVNQLTDEVKNLKEKNKNLEEKNKELEIHNKTLEQRIEKIEKYLFPRKENFEQEKENRKDLSIIRQWLPNRHVQLILLYKKSRDGSSSEVFHKLCDNKGTTIIIIETTEGRKFGGVTHDNWNTDGIWRKSTNDFVFSLDSKEKFDYCWGNSTMGNKENVITFGYYMNSSENAISFKNYSLDEGIANKSLLKIINNSTFENESFKTKEVVVYGIYHGLSRFKPIGRKFI